MKDFLLIIKNTIFWLTIFSGAIVTSYFINFNLIKVVILWLIVLEIILFFSPKDAIKTYLSPNYVHNYALNFIFGIICFSLFFFQILDKDIFSELNTFYLGVLYIIYETILLIRSFLYEKGYFPKRYYEGVKNV